MGAHAGKSVWGLMPLVLAITACATSNTAFQQPYVGRIETVAPTDEEPSQVRGVVFADDNGDSVRQAGEPGVAGVLVSNGVQVVPTDADGAYTLPARPDMSVFVIKPSGWRTPVDANSVPQFAYQHKPDGSPPLRFGGLEATGPLPSAINFPLTPAGAEDTHTCAVIGDTQPNNNDQVGFSRDSVAKDLIAQGEDAYACLLFMGDLVGDDLSLLPRLTNIMGQVGAPLYYVHGNHDLDFDADDDAHSSDTWRRLWGPNYYAFEIGDVLYVALDNIYYPCGEADAARGDRDFCVDPNRPTYNGWITDNQLTWLENLLTHVPDDKLIVIATHIPFVSFVFADNPRHSTDNANAVYELLKDRKALALAGHTHTTEHHAAGDHYAPWETTVGVRELPFPHIIAGAASGSWWWGDYSIDGVPMALQRLGAPRGHLELAVDGSDYTATYYGGGLSRDRRMFLSMSTPAFREWFSQLDAYRALSEADRPDIPPVSIHDLPDIKLLTPRDLNEGAYLTANVWMGDSNTEVFVSLDSGETAALTRTQQAEGEAIGIGADFADPFSVQRQLTVARRAIVSSSGDDATQGASMGRRNFGPGAPQPMPSVTDRSMHLWRLRLPENLEEGAHVAVVTARFGDGRVAEERLVFEVRAERPNRFWDPELWD